VRTPGIQRGLDFLVALPQLEADGKLQGARLLPRIDYDSIVRLGAANGYDFTPSEVSEAFRIFMRSRRLVLKGTGA
jgi:hypothetical protein